MSHPLETNRGLRYNGYKHHSNIKESIDINFIGNGPLVFEFIEDKQRNINLCNILYNHDLLYITNSNRSKNDKFN